MLGYFGNIKSLNVNSTFLALSLHMKVENWLIFNFSVKI